MYLVCDGEGRACGRFPLALAVCPVCSGGIKQSRGWTWIEPAELFAGQPCVAEPHICGFCPLLDLDLGRSGLLWVGAMHYKTPAHFDLESAALGVSRRISAIPKDFVLGETWVFLAHPNVIPGQNDEGEQVLLPGAFKLFKPSAIEQIVTETQADDKDEMAKLTERGITAVVVPDDDKDHNP
jgi:hypothetical protein